MQVTPAFVKLVNGLCPLTFQDANLGVSSGSTCTPMPTKIPAKLGAEKLTLEEQRRRFEELANEAGCGEELEAQFEWAVKAICQAKPGTTKDPSSNWD